MKNILKTLMVSLLALSLCLSFGCESSKDKNDKSTTTATTTVTTTAPPEPEGPRVFSSWVSALFGGGPFVTGMAGNKGVLKKSGFNTIIIWSVHVQENGDLVLNDIPVVSGGELKPMVKKVYSKAWADLRKGETSIERIEISIGAWGCADFENIKNLIARDGTGEDTILYKNFKALLEATTADAVNFDDESCYDVNSATKFGKMCADMGAKVTLCPYTNQSFWKSVAKNLGDICDRIYLQCYDGGAGNNPADWTKLFGTKVIPGYWCIHGGSGDSAKSVGNKLKASKNDITGGFIWYFDDLQKLGSPNSTADYAKAINSLAPKE